MKLTRSDLKYFAILVYDTKDYEITIFCLIHVLHSF